MNIKKLSNITLNNLKNSLFEKDIKVKSFWVPRFIKKNIFTSLLNKTNGTFNANYKYDLFKLIGDNVGIFNKNNINTTIKETKDSSLPQSSSSNFMSKGNLKLSLENKNTKNALLVEAIKENKPTIPIVFTSYVEKLNLVANKFKELNDPNKSLWSKKNLENNTSIKPLQPLINSNNSMKDLNKLTPNPLSNNINKTTNFKSNTLTPALDNNLNNKGKDLTSPTLRSDNVLNSINNKPFINSLNDIQAYCKDIKNTLKEVNLKKTQDYNKLLAEITKKISKKIKNLSPSVSEIKKEINNLVSHKELISDKFQDTLKDIEASLKDIKKTTDLNGVDLELIQDTLKEFEFKELFSLLKVLNENIQLLLQQSTLNKENTINESSLNEKINNLEKNIKIYNNEQITYLTKQLESLNKAQENGVKQQSHNIEIIMNSINSLKNVVTTKPSLLDNLNSKLNEILLGQRSLSTDADKIKEYVLSNNKDISYIKDSHNTNKLVSLIEDLKNKKVHSEQKQDHINEKIHQDMELIKKSIIKLIEEQYKTTGNKNNVSHIKSTSGAHTNLQPKNVSGELETSSGTITKDTKNVKFSKPEQNNLNNNNSSSNTSLQKMAIGKLKEALDLESIESSQNTKNEYIDEIIESCVVTKKVEDKGVGNNTSSIGSKVVNKNINKNNEPSTFVLDTSKFFK